MKKMLSVGLFWTVNFALYYYLSKPSDSQTPENYWQTICIPTAIFSGILIGYFQYKCHRLNEKLSEQKRNGVLADLEFATKEDLHKELQRRSLTSILLRPMDDHDKKDGFQMEVVGLDPISTLSNLSLAAKMLSMELQNRGMCPDEAEPHDSEFPGEAEPYDSEFDNEDN
jgi:hypothetical protein